MSKITSSQYWDNKYVSGQTGWDIGYASPPLIEYFNQIKDKNIRILIPGAGNAWEVEYLYNKGFKNVFLLDFAESNINNFKKRCPDFPDEQILHMDFFDHKEKYNLIVEQTFFSSFHPRDRQKFVDHLQFILLPQGKYMGLLFNHGFDFQGPPFGGTTRTYFNLFKKRFNIIHFDTANNSIKPRKERELFILLTIK